MIRCVYWRQTNYTDRNNNSMVSIRIGVTDATTPEDLDQRLHCVLGEVFVHRR